MSIHFTYILNNSMKMKASVQLFGVNVWSRESPLSVCRVRQKISTKIFAVFLDIANWHFKAKFLQHV